MSLATAAPTQAQQPIGELGGTPLAELDGLVFPAPDLAAMPAQVRYQDWPPDQLRLRPYWLPWSWLSFDRAALFNRPVLFVLTVVTLGYWLAERYRFKPAREAAAA